MSISIVCPYELIGPPTISNLNSLQLDSIAFISTKESKLNFTNYLHTYVVSIATYSREFSWTKSRNKKSISRAIFDTYDGRCLWAVASTGKRNRSWSHEVISGLSLTFNYQPRIQKFTYISPTRLLCLFTSCCFFVGNNLFK